MRKQLIRGCGRRQGRLPLLHLLLHVDRIDRGEHGLAVGDRADRHDEPLGLAGGCRQRRQHDDGDGQVNLEDRMNAIDLSYDGESGTTSSAKAAARASTSFTASAAKSFHMEASLRSEKRAA